MLMEPFYGARPMAEVVKIRANKLFRPVMGAMPLPVMRKVRTATEAIMRAFMTIGSFGWIAKETYYGKRVLA